MPKHRKASWSFYENFADVAMLMLSMFIFLFVTTIITARLNEENELPKLKRQLAALQEELQITEADKERFKEDLERVLVTDPEGQIDIILEAASVGRKDFDLFVQGLKEIPGKEVHLIVDASGSMHGVSNFLVPILRLIVTRAGKELAAITWFSDRSAETYTGSMGEMFDNLMSGAPFSGNVENIGRAFRSAAQNAAPPGAYLLIGDEPSDDTIQYSNIPSPVFTLPFGRSDSSTEVEYQTLADKTGGKMLHLDFK